MPPQVIPDRLPVSDAFTGVVVRVAAGTALALAPDPGLETLASGVFIIRYGVRFLGKPQQHITPGLVVMDYGDMLTGEAAWEFLWKHSNLHPRSEVVGIRDDGREDIVFFRQLDLGIPPAALVYTAESAPAPIAVASALIATRSDGLPARLTETLPCYPTAADWLAAL